MAMVEMVPALEAVAAADMARGKYVNMAAKDMAQVVLADSQVQKGFA